MQTGESWGIQAPLPYSKLRQTRKILQVNWELPAVMVFNNLDWKSFSCIPELELTTFKASIVEVAAKCCGQVTGASWRTNFRTRWWMPEKGLQAEEEGLLGWVAGGSAKAADRYCVGRRAAARAVTEANPGVGGVWFDLILDLRCGEELKHPEEAQSTVAAPPLRWKKPTQVKDLFLIWWGGWQSAPMLHSFDSLLQRPLDGGGWGQRQ